MEKHCDKKEKLLVLSNFFFCHYVFKQPSAAEASKKRLYEGKVYRVIEAMLV